MPSPYLIPTTPVIVEQKVKRSVFICYLQHSPTREAAMSFIDKIRLKHNDANHNCWAFVAGAPNDPSNWGMNDDGEPKGCAGKPMFNVLHHSNIGEICAVVSRYFGGIKLGTGGMARAYSAAVQGGLEELQTTHKKHYEQVTLLLDYNMIKDVEHILQAHEAIITDQVFAEQVTLQIDLLSGTKPEVDQQLQHLSKGRLAFFKS